MQTLARDEIYRERGMPNSALLIHGPKGGGRINLLMPSADKAKGQDFFLIKSLQTAVYDSV